METAAPDTALSDLVAALKAEAQAVGFASCGVAPATGPAVDRMGARLRAALAAGRHGEMAWMTDRADQRAAPTALWDRAQSVVMLAENYGPAEDPMALLQRPERGVVSVYARGRDYHDPVKKRLKRLGRWLIAEAERRGLGSPEIKVFVDTAPVMEKPLAEAAGLGWIGKHSNLVSRGHGSWTFLGAIFVDLALPPDRAETDHCGACRRCLDICPTAAFPAPYQLDARRCISYLTIELKGPIPRPFRPLIGNRIYGCDDCLAVCPWNKFAHTAAEAGYWARLELAAPPLADLAALDEAGFRTVFSGSPIKRIGLDRFHRNVAIALGNARRADALGPALALLDAPGPLARGAAVWAVARLDAERFAAERAVRAEPEPDETVRAEWAAGARG